MVYGDYFLARCIDFLELCHHREVEVTETRYNVFRRTQRSVLLKELNYFVYYHHHHASPQLLCTLGFLEVVSLTTHKQRNVDQDKLKEALFRGVTKPEKVENLYCYTVIEVPDQEAGQNLCPLLHIETHLKFFISYDIMVESPLLLLLRRVKWEV